MPIIGAYGRWIRSICDLFLHLRLPIQSSQGALSQWRIKGVGGRTQGPSCHRSSSSLCAPSGRILHCVRTHTPPRYCCWNHRSNDARGRSGRLPGPWKYNRTTMAPCWCQTNHDRPHRAASMVLTAALDVRQTGRGRKYIPSYQSGVNNAWY